MANVDLTIDPYYDKFNASNNRTMVIFQKDKVVQTAELNEMQSIESHYLQTLGNAIMTDGDKQSGMAYSISNNVVTVNSGTVYLAGKVRPFSQQTVNISGIGIETVGIRLDQKIITSDDDSYLLNPALNTPGYQAKGANRLQETITLIANDSSATTIYTFKDGAIYNIPGNPQLSKINDILSQRTNDINGSFVVGNTGFAIRTDDDPKDSSKALVTIDAGLAYVQGIRINKVVPEFIEVPKSLTTNQIIDEETQYSQVTLQYTLGYPYVSSVTSVSANVRQTTTVNRGSSSIDNIGIDNVVSIDSVFTEGTNSKTYINGTDYQLLNHHQISWIAGGNAPTNGSSYRVTVIYNKQLVPKDDYTTSVNDSNQSIIDFTGKGIVSSGDSNGGTIADKSNLNISYSYYLARVDLVTLNDKGVYNISQGNPGVYGKSFPSESNDPKVLPIGLIYWKPNSAISSYTNIAPSNLTMKDLVNLKKTVNNTQFNQALNALNDVASAKYDPTQLRGVFSDGFISLDKSDINNSDYGVMMSFANATVTPIFTNQKATTPSIDTDNSNVQISPDGQYVTSGYSEQTMINQNIGTDPILLNEYAYDSKEGIMKLDPSEDSWNGVIDDGVVSSKPSQA